MMRGYTNIIFIFDLLSFRLVLVDLPLVPRLKLHWATGTLPPSLAHMGWFLIRYMDNFNFLGDKILCDVNKVLICMLFQVLLNVTNMALDFLYKA